MARILLVEEDDHIRLYLARILERSGHSVHSQDSSRAALDFMEQDTGTIDLLISDLTLSGMTGIGLVNLLFAKNRKGHCIFTSEKKFGEILPPNPAAKRCFLQKPFSGAAIVAMAEELFQKT